MDQITFCCFISSNFRFSWACFVKKIIFYLFSFENMCTCVLTVGKYMPGAHGAKTDLALGYSEPTM